mmetsp:Transcript_13159/g.26244  ORF Transcript_13159/g.26244 Transcript_13159/m.26244 type:complete len:125 (+) Transcript_13159:67-441(+)
MSCAVMKLDYSYFLEFVEMNYSLILFASSECHYVMALLECYFALTMTGYWPLSALHCSHEVDENDYFDLSLVFVHHFLIAINIYSPFVVHPSIYCLHPDQEHASDHYFGLVASNLRLQRRHGTH